MDCFIARKNDEAIPKLPLFVTLVISLLVVVVSCDLGWYLSLLFTKYRSDIPAPIQTIIRLYRSVTNQCPDSNCDDMAYFVINLYWAVATLLISVPVIIFCLAIRRFIHRKTS